MAHYFTKKGRRDIWVTPGQLEESRKKRRESEAKRRVEKPEKIKESIKRWCDANPEKAREKANRWARNNPEKHRAAIRRWNASHPCEARAWNAKRRAKERSAKHPDHSGGIELALVKSATRLRKCLGIDFHIDHVMPLARGGMHHHTNLRVLPGRLNVIKHDKLDDELTGKIQIAIKQWSAFLN